MNPSKKHREFYEELASLMIRHGIRDIKRLDCKVTEVGKLLFNKDHLIVNDDDRTLYKYGDIADEIISESLINLALDKRNRKLFDNVLRGDLYSQNNDE